MERIFIIDDNQAFVDALKKILEWSGQFTAINNHSYSNDEQRNRLLEEIEARYNEYDSILCDLLLTNEEEKKDPYQMRNGVSIKLYHDVKELWKIKNLIPKPFIFITGNTHWVNRLFKQIPTIRNDADAILILRRYNDLDADRYKPGNPNKEYCGQCPQDLFQCGEKYANCTTSDCFVKCVEGAIKWLQEKIAAHLA